MFDFQRVEFRTRDGVLLRGDFFPSDTPNAPIAVMASGFSITKELAHGFALKLRAAGIAALAFDPRGLGSSDGLPRQEINLQQQATDFHDAITAGMDLPGVNPAKVIMWGIGHGASAAMMAAGNDPRLAAVILHAPSPSGTVDAANFPEGVLDRAWRERESLARNPGAQLSYVKAWRDWLEDGDGDEKTVFIHGAAGYYLMQGMKALSDAAGTPWENQVTLQTFLHLASTEPQDHAHKIKHPTLYIVNENDPFLAQPDVQRKVFERMGPNAEFQVVSQGQGEELGDQLNKGVDAQIKWLKRVL